MSEPVLEPLAMVGAGYVGLVSVVGLAELGYEVHCIEANPDRLAMLRHGEVPFFEPGLEDGLRNHRDRLHFSSDYDEGVRRACRLFFVAVGTPTSATGEADLRAIWSVMDSIPLTSGQAVVMKSTVPPGTGVECRRRLDARGLDDVIYVSNPEFLSESTGLSDFRNPDRVVIGDATWAGDAVAEVYAPLMPSDLVIRTDVTTAETLKLAANAFLAAKISFVNEVANVCDAAGADVTALARAIGLDPRIGPLFLRAGIGFGGSCFGKDLKSLAFESRRLGATSHMVDAVLAVNDRQWDRVLAKLASHLGGLEGRTVTLLGVSFKPGTSNVRDANSIPLLAGLSEAGVEVRAYDPEATREILLRDTVLTEQVLADVKFCSSAIESVTGADAAVLVTEWAEILALDWAEVRGAMDGTLLIDGRNALDPSTISAAGLTYDGIGRPTVEPLARG